MPCMSIVLKCVYAWKVACLTLFLSLDSILSLHEGLLSCLLSSLFPFPATRVAVVVTVVVAVEPGRAGEAGPGAGLAPPPGLLITSCWSSVVLTPEVNTLQSMRKKTSIF